MMITFTIKPANSADEHTFQADVTEQSSNALHAIFDNDKAVERLRDALGGPGTAPQTKFTITTNEKPPRVFTGCMLGVSAGREVSITHA